MSIEQQNDSIGTTKPGPIESSAGSDSGDEIVARLCHIIKRPDFDGYGFNLHSEKGKLGQYIGKVDSDSPAEHSGMREGDRILEVNGVNIGSETHKQVVQRIKAMSNEVRLLVVDNGVEVTKNNEIVSKFVIRQCSSAPSNTNNPDNDAPINNCDNNNVNNNTSIPSSPSISIKSDSNKSDIIKNNNNNNNTNNHTPIPSSKNNIVQTDSNTQSNGQQKTTNEMDEPDRPKAAPIVSSPIADKSVSLKLETATTAPTPPQSKSQSDDVPNMTSLNLKMSAAEMRARLKKKHDPKRDTVDLKSKYDIIQKL